MAQETAYHYTSVQALLEMVRSKRFRLSNVFFMNDYMEVEWFSRQVREEMDRRTNHGTRNDFEYLGFLRGKTSQERFDYVFCGCFSRMEDDLSQWRGYADDGRGIAIGVELSQVVKANSRPDLDSPEDREVIYGKAEQMRLVTETLDAFVEEAAKAEAKHGSRGAALPDIYHSTTRANLALARHAVVCKNPAFAGEREVRLVLRPSIDLSWHEKPSYKPVFFKRFPHGVEFWHRGGRIVPYADVDLPMESIRSLRLGPKFGGDMETAALQLFLSKEGIEHTVLQGLTRSGATYR
jgi:hypothetical protein